MNMLNHILRATWKAGLFSSLALLIMLSCKKDNANTPNYDISIPQEVYDYAYFKKGSYWVYEDSATHVLDSIYVTKDSSGTWKVLKESGLGYTGSFGWFTNDMHSSYSGWDYRVWISQIWAIGKSQSRTYIERSKPSVPTVTNLYFNNKFTAGYKEQHQYGLYTFWYSYNKYIVLNDTFDNTICVQSDKNAAESMNNTYYYISKRVGIIKKVLVDSQRVWNLKRYHIVP